MGCVGMNIATILQGVQKIYIDTALFIYFVENNPVYRHENEDAGSHLYPRHAIGQSHRRTRRIQGARRCHRTYDCGVRRSSAPNVIPCRLPGEFRVRGMPRTCDYWGQPAWNLLGMPWDNRIGARGGFRVRGMPRTCDVAVRGSPVAPSVNANVVCGAVG